MQLTATCRCHQIRRDKLRSQWTRRVPHVASHTERCGQCLPTLRSRVQRRVKVEKKARKSRTELLLRPANQRLTGDPPRMTSPLGVQRAVRSRGSIRSFVPQPLLVAAKMYISSAAQQSSAIQAVRSRVQAGRSFIGHEMVDVTCGVHSQSLE